MSAFETGLMLIPMTAGMMTASFAAPKMAMKIGHKYTMVLGFVISIGGCLIMRNRFTLDTGFMSLFPCLLIFGMGLGLPSSLSEDVPLAAIPPRAQNSCSGLVSTGQNLGLSIGTAIIAMGLVMMVIVGLMVLGIILTLSFDDIKNEKR